MPDNNASSKFQPLRSSLLQAYSYDVDSHALSIVFKDGTQMLYKNVLPPLLSQVFDSGGSVGSKFMKLIARSYSGIKQ